MKQANVGKKFESQKFNDIWCLQCCPNGRNSKSSGGLRLYLQLCSLPKGVGSIYIQYTIWCKEIKSEDKGIIIMFISLFFLQKETGSLRIFSSFFFLLWFIENPLLL